jgi:hypothetical protein
MSNNGKQQFNLKNHRHQFLLIKAAKAAFTDKSNIEKVRLLQCLFTQPYPSSYNAHNQVLLLKNNENKKISNPDGFNSDSIIDEVEQACNNDIKTYTKNPENTDKFNSVYFGFVESFFDGVKNLFGNNPTNQERMASDKAYRSAIRITNNIMMGQNPDTYIKNLKIVTSGMDRLRQYTRDRIMEIVGNDKMSNMNNKLKTPQQPVKKSLLARLKEKLFSRSKKSSPHHQAGGKSRKNRKSRRTHKKRKHN